MTVLPLTEAVLEVAVVVVGVLALCLSLVHDVVQSNVTVICRGCNGLELILESLLSNYFSTFITAIQSIWCNLVQNTSELLQSFVSQDAQNYLEETAKMLKC